MPPALFFLRTLLAIQGFLFFHTNFTIVFSNSVKNATDILIKFHMLYFFIHSFIVSLAASGLRCFVWAFSSCGMWELLSSCSAWGFSLRWLLLL